MHIYYRLSDMGENKNKMSQVNNKNCLNNFIKEFGAENIVLIADNVEDETWDWVNTYSFKEFHRTRLGNAQSFWFAFEEALKLPKNEYVYFVENDYIHKPNAKKALLEGLVISDYVSLYDHPDKYVEGINPQVKNGGELSRIYISDSAHWKSTNSTTMTFAAIVNALQKDKLIFKFFTKGIVKNGFPILKRFQERKIPSDYQIFRFLKRFKRRELISPIPAFSTHAEIEYLAPLHNWNKILES
jgi:hypothetical protein